MTWFVDDEADADADADADVLFPIAMFGMYMLLTNQYL